MAKTADELQALREDIQAMKGDLAQVLESLEEDGEGKWEEIKMKLVDTTKKLEERAAEQLQDAYTAAKDEGEKAVGAARKEISKRPLTVVLTSFVIGLLVGSLFSRS